MFILRINLAPLNTATKTKRLTFCSCKPRGKEYFNFFLQRFTFSIFYKYEILEGVLIPQFVAKKKIIMRLLLKNSNKAIMRNKVYVKVCKMHKDKAVIVVFCGRKIYPFPQFTANFITFHEKS